VWRFVIRGFVKDYVTGGSFQYKVGAPGAGLVSKNK
jgi:hypothetical protein